MQFNSIAVHRCALLFRSNSVQSQAIPFPSKSALSHAQPLRVNAFQSFSSAVLSPALPWLVYATPLLRCSRPRHSAALPLTATQYHALARLFSAQLFLCFALLSHAVPLRCHSSISIAAAELLIAFQAVPSRSFSDLCHPCFASALRRGTRLCLSSVLPR